MWVKLLTAAATACAILGVGWFSYEAGMTAGEQRVQSRWNAEVERLVAAQAEELAKARQRESALHDLARKLRQEKADEARRLAREYAADIERLRDRPTRDSAGELPGSAAPGAEPAPGCTGANLFREDAAVLVGIARDADQIRLALRQCQAQYNAIRGELNVQHQD